MNKQKGFSAVEGLLIILAAVLVGFGGWYVWSQPKSNKIETSNNSAQPKAENFEGQTDKSDIPSGWKTLTQNGITFAYPEEWDELEGLSVHKVDNVSIIGEGRPSPFYYEYTEDGTWLHKGLNDEIIDDEQPPMPDAQVKYSRATILLNRGDGLCGNYFLGILSENNAYYIHFPTYCSAHGDIEESGLRKEDLDKILYTIIESVRISE